MPSDSDFTPPNDSGQPPIEGEVIRPVADFGRPPGLPRRGMQPLGESYEQSFLRNPYVLAGFAVGGAIVLAVIVVFMFGSKSSTAKDGGSPGVILDPLTPGAGRGLVARSVSASTVREGPGLDYDAIGELSRNQDVEVAGRNTEATWFNIYFPSGSSLRGWVPASALRLPNNAPAIPVVSVTPIPRPTVIQPTAPPEPTGTATGSPTPTATGTPAGGSDLVASIVAGTCSVGSRLIVNVKNLGPAAITSRAIAVLVQAADGSQRALAAQTATIPAGGQIDIDTTYVVQERVVATIDPLGTLGDPNAGNNRVDCVVATVPTQIGGAFTPTRTPTPPFGVTATPTKTP
jgi:hypothetical protein